MERSLFNNSDELQMLNFEKKPTKNGFSVPLSSSLTATLTRPLFSSHLLPPCCPFSSSFVFSSLLQSPHPQSLPPCSLPSSPQLHISTPCIHSTLLSFPSPMQSLPSLFFVSLPFSNSAYTSLIPTFAILIFSSLQSSNSA
jgi:hypothetical protein